MILPTTMATFVPAPIKAAVDSSVLDRLDIRLGRIQAVDGIAQSRKLVKLTVSFGDHTRTVLAGMKQERADLQSLVGRQALFVVNLEPRTMAGHVSQGMLLDIGYADGLTPALGGRRSDEMHRPPSPTRCPRERGQGRR